MNNLSSTISDIGNALQAGTTLPVQLWMAWMALVFMASIFFVRRHFAARLVLVSFFLTAASVLYIWSLTQNIHLFGVAHLWIWLPLGLYLAINVLYKRDRSKGYSPYYIWVLLMVFTIFTSLAFDIRDIFLVMYGIK